MSSHVASPTSTANAARRHVLRAAAAAVVESLESRQLLSVTLPAEPTTYAVNITVDDDYTADVAGSQYRTLGAAIDYANSANALGAATPKSTKIFVKNGTYREPLGKTLNKGGDTILTIEGESSTGVNIKGTSVYSSGWTEVSGQPGVWQHDWTPNLLMQGYDGSNGPRFTLNQRTEMMFANGQRLTPVELEKWTIDWVNNTRFKYTYKGWAGFAGMKDYTFGVAELGNTAADTTASTEGMLYTGNTTDGYETLSEIYNGTRIENSASVSNAHGFANKIFVKLPSGVNPNASTTEISDQDNNGVKPGTSRVLNIQKNNVVLRNLKFIGYANVGHSKDNGVIHAGVESYNRTGQVAQEKIRLQNVEVTSNANMGMTLQGIKNLSVENSRFKDNGMNGTSGGRMTESQYVDSTWEGSNWRSDNFGGNYGWAAANFKFFLARDQTFLRCSFLNGDKHGLWFDGNGMNNVIQDSVANGNRRFGYWVEICAGPFLFKNSRAENNGEAGMEISNSRNVLVDGGTYMNNGLAQIDINGFNPGSRFMAHGSGSPFAADNSRLGTTTTPAGAPSNLDFLIHTGNITIKNAYIATGMGNKSRLIKVDERSDTRVLTSGSFLSETERENFLKAEYHGSGNTFHYNGDDAAKAFQIGDDTYKLADWVTKSGESGSTSSSTNFRYTTAIATTSSSGFSKTGSWSTTTSSSSRYGATYLSDGGNWTSTVNAKGVNTATFTPTIPTGQGGDYDIQVLRYWTNFEGSTSTPITITYNGGTQTKNIDYNFSSYGSGPVWVTLATLPLAAGSTDKVVISNPAAKQNTYVDVVRFVRKPDNAVPTGTTTVSTMPALPGAVTNLTATAQNNRVTLSWTAATGTFTGYTIRYGIGTGGATKDYNGVIHVANNVTSVNVDNLTSGQTYEFSVAAEGTAGHGAAAVRTATPTGSMVERTRDGGTVTARGDDGTNVKANAFDNNTSTKWKDTGAVDQKWLFDTLDGKSTWLGYDFAGENAYVITRFVVTSGDDVASNTAQAPTGYRLRGSNDGGVTWTILYMAVNRTANVANSTDETIEVANTRAFKMYRLDMRPSSGTTVQVGEVRLYSPATAAAATTPAEHVAINFNTTSGTATTNNQAPSGTSIGNANSVAGVTTSTSVTAPTVNGSGGAVGQYATGTTTTTGGVKWNDSTTASWKNQSRMTMTAWIRPTAIGTAGNVIWNNNQGGGGDGFALQVINTGTTSSPTYRLQFIAKMNGTYATQTVTSTSAISLNTWQFVAVTIDTSDAGTGDALRLYVGDGTTLSASGSLTGNLGTTVRANTEGLSFGGGMRSKYDFAGQMDNGRFYSGKTLTVDELTAIMKLNDRA